MSFLGVSRDVWQMIFNYLSTNDAKKICSTCRFFNVNFWANRITLKVYVGNLVHGPLPYQFSMIQELIIIRSKLSNIEFYSWMEKWPILYKVRSLIIDRISPGEFDNIINKMPNLRKLDTDISTVAHYANIYGWDFFPENFILQLTDFTLKGMFTIYQPSILGKLNKSLKNCQKLCFDSVPIYGSQTLFSGLNNVRSLKLSGVNINDETIKIVVNEMPKLRELVIPRKNNKQLTAGALWNLCQLNDLRSLNISGFSDCSDLITDSIFEANTKLTKICMNGCSSLTDLTIHSVKRHLPDIRDISFRDCYLFTDKIFLFLSSLPIRTMNFATCPNLSDRGIEQYCSAWKNGNPNLLVVNFSGSSKITCVGKILIKNTCRNLISIKEK